jgi:hypothetical protein
LLEHLIIPESKHAIAAQIEILGSLGVGSDLSIFTMTTAINLDDQPMLMACKICEKSADCGLSPEVSTLHRQVPQVPPQLSLGISHCTTQ